MRYPAFFSLLLALCGCPSPAEGGTKDTKAAPKTQSTTPGAALLAPGSPLATPDAQRALSELSSNPKAAAETLLKLADKAKGDDALRLRFAAGIALSRAGDQARAAPLFADLADTYPALAGYSAAFAAESYALLSRDADAISWAEKVTLGQPIARFALRIRAEAKDHSSAKDAEQAWLDFLTESPRSPRGEKAWGRVAELRRARGDSKGLAEADRQLVAGWPGSSSSKEAQAELDKLAVSLGKTAVALSPEEKERRAQVSLDAQRHKEAEGLLRDLVDTAPKGATRCRAFVSLGRSIQKQRDFSRAGAVFLDAADACTGHDANQRRDALYLAGKAFQRAEKCKAANPAYALVEKEFPSDSLADDARLHRGECLRALKDSTANEVLRSVVVDYPSGDMAEEAVWSLAWDAYLRDDFSTAEPLLEDGHKALTRVTNYWSEGRLGYWLGRVREKQGKTKTAKEAYAQVMKGYPLSYYARLAYLRLHDLDKKAAEKAMLAKPSKPAATAVVDAGAVAVSKEPAFVRGQELLLLGLVDYARDEFATLKAEDSESLWLVADRYDHAEAFPWSHNIPRRKVPEFRFSPPTTAQDARRWEVAYPDVFAPLIDDWSSKNGVPAPLSFAIMREESSFNPGIESYAHAIGLMQLLVPTANDQAKAMGRAKVSASDLRDPETNIALGTKYLSYLLTYFDGNVVLVAAGYNAGQGAVRRWVREFGKIPLDEFVERIPYEETRRYTQRVMTSCEVYAHLYQLPRADLSFTLPTF